MGSRRLELGNPAATAQQVLADGVREVEGEPPAWYGHSHWRSHDLRGGLTVRLCCFIHAVVARPAALVVLLDPLPSCRADAAVARAGAPVACQNRLCSSPTGPSTHTAFSPSLLGSRARTHSASTPLAQALKHSPVCLNLPTAGAGLAPRAVHWAGGAARGAARLAAQRGGAGGGLGSGS